MSDDPTRIPAAHGKAARLTAGQQVKLINTPGSQVVDMWALNPYELREHVCMAATRVWNQRINPQVGDVLVTNQRRVMLTIVEDTTPGIHDTLMAACDRHRYGLLGVEGYHRNCQDNMIEGLAELGVTPPGPISASFNVFMNIPVGEDRNALDFLPTACAPGQFITFRAELDCLVAFSSCPQDILPILGEGGQPPKDAHFQVLA